MNAARIGEEALRILDRGGVRGERAVVTFSAVIALNYGWSGFGTRRQPAGEDDDDRPAMEAQLGALPADEFPLTISVAAAMSDYGSDAHYLSALRALLVGSMLNSPASAGVGSEWTNPPEGGPMELAVLGTGSAGRAIAARLAELGHEVSIGTRDPDATRARADYGDGPATIPQVRTGDVRRRPAAAEVVLHVTQRCLRARPTRPGRCGQPRRQGPHRCLQPSRLQPGDAAHAVREGHRLAGRADPARVPPRPGWSRRSTP